MPPLDAFELDRMQRAPLPGDTKRLVQEVERLRGILARVGELCSKWGCYHGKLYNCRQQCAGVLAEIGEVVNAETS